MNDKYQTRKGIRLKEYDYSQAGYYYITVCVKEMQQKLGSVVGAATCCPYVELTEIGRVAETSITKIPQVHSAATVDKYVIMPNHLHMILVIGNGGGRQVAAPTVQTIIAGMKRAVSLECGLPIWQKSFHDRIIRDEVEYENAWKYIDENPLKWVDDKYDRT